MQFFHILNNFLFTAETANVQRLTDGIPLRTPGIEVPVSALGQIDLPVAFLAGNGQRQLQAACPSLRVDEHERRCVCLALIPFYKAPQIRKAGASARCMRKVSPAPLVHIAAPAVRRLALGAVHWAFEGWKIVLLTH